MKRQATHWEEIAANYIYNKVLVSRIYKGNLEFKNNENENLIKIQGKI